MAENITRVTDEHPDYQLRLAQWARIEDALEGRDAVHGRKESYLPMLGGQDEDQYKAYLGRAPWYGASARTLEAMVGMVFRKQPVTTFGIQAQDEWLEDITLSDETYEEFAKNTYRDVISLGRTGVMVDFVTEAQKNEGIEALERPYLAQYDPRAIRNWRTRRIGGKSLLDQVVLREDVEEADAGGFGTVLKTRYRVLELLPLVDLALLVDAFEIPQVQMPEDAQYVYGVSVWEMVEREAAGVDAKTAEWERVEFYVPNRNGVALREIPFIFISPAGTKMGVEKPPLLDMVDTNFDHYRLSADYRHGLHFTGLPTAWVAGFPVDSKLEIGSETAWISDDASANAGFLEFTGQGLNPLREAIEATENKMAVLGARLLETQKKMAETAETWRIRQGGEQSILISSIDAVTKGLMKALWWMSWWGGADDPQVSSEINRDLVSVPADPQMFAHMLQSLLAGKISQQLWLEWLEENEILHMRSKEEELAAIESDGVNAPADDLGDENEVEPPVLTAA